MGDVPKDFVNPRKHRLDSWKQIAGHFGNDPRTVQRWEGEGLPVYREGGKVYAYAEDLDEWQRQRTLGPQSNNEKAVPDTQSRLLNVSVIKIGTFVAAAVAIAAALLTIRGPDLAPTPNEKRPRRLFAGATSEGHSPRHVETGERYIGLLIAPDGKSLYASSWDSRSITVFGVEDLQVRRTIKLPHPLRNVFLSRNGRHIYISSLENGVMVVDPTRGVEKVIPTSKPVFDVAVSPDEKKLFLAMGYGGLHRVNLQTGETRVLSPLACPVRLNINPSGRHLYVSYQCGGPGGRGGHDAVDIYDIESEQSIEVINGLAMVGGLPSFAPQSEDLVLLNGMDACSSPDYDHVGCSIVPSSPFYLWRASDHRSIANLSYPEPHTHATLFPQGTRIAYLGSELQIWDWARQMALETMSLTGMSFGGFAVTASGDRAFVSLAHETGLLAFDAEKEECLPPVQGLVNSYAGDGTRDDSQGSSTLTFEGQRKFEPGLMGQAFSFSGNGDFLLARKGAAFCNFCSEPWSVSFFAKFRSSAGDMTILERETTDPVWDLRLLKSNDNRVVLTARGEAASKFSLTSQMRVDAGRWYHLAVVTKKDGRSLYIDGVLQGAQNLATTIEPPDADVDRRNIFFGATQGKRDFINGLIDEIAVYDRALTPGEITKIAAACGSTK